MSQYSLDFTRWTPDQPPFTEWQITAPTTRRLALGLVTARQVEGTAAAGRRLTLDADNRGNSAITVAVDTMEECRQINDSPGFQRRGDQWHANRPRYGTWGWYLAEVALVHDIFDFCGWTPAPEEAQLMDALEEYGKASAGAVRDGRVAPATGHRRSDAGTRQRVDGLLCV